MEAELIAVVAELSVRNWLEGGPPAQVEGERNAERQKTQKGTTLPQVTKRFLGKTKDKIPFPTRKICHD